jgi:hypothetical protein
MVGTIPARRQYLHLASGVVGETVSANNILTYQVLLLAKADCQVASIASSPLVPLTESLWGSTHGLQPQEALVSGTWNVVVPFGSYKGQCFAGVNQKFAEPGAARQL